MIVNTFSLFRGDTFIKTLKLSEKLKINDIVKYAVIDKESEEKIYENEIVLDQSTDEVELTIPSSETVKFPIKILIFEVEVTYSNIVKTNQYLLDVKRDGIYERD